MNSNPFSNKEQSDFYEQKNSVEDFYASKHYDYYIHKKTPCISLYN
jgi:hypothetical protein